MKEEIKQYVDSLYQDVPTSVYEGLLSVFCLGAVIIIGLYGWNQGWRKIAGLLLVEYVFLIYYSTVIIRTKVEGVGYNFHPFWSYGEPRLFVENIMNVAVFVPVGVLTGLVLRGIRWWQVLIAGSVLSISIETLQFFLKRGFSEIDDVMHNTLGYVIGYWIYMMVASARKLLT